MKREDFVDKYFINVQYQKSNPDWYYVRRSILKSLTEQLPKFKGKLLDVGCGIMPYREYMMENNANLTSYIGLDFETAISDEYAMVKPDLIWGGISIPLEDKSMDVVMATEFFEHCPNPEDISKEIWRVLKPGGVLFLTVPFLWNLHIVPYDEYRYTPFALTRILSKAGFGRIEIESLGGWHASMAQMLGLWHRNAPVHPRLRTMIGYIVKPLMKFLIRKDNGFNKKEFIEGTMMTGLSGVAYK